MPQILIKAQVILHRPRFWALQYVHTTLLIITGLLGCMAIITNLITMIAVAKFEFLKDEPTSRFVISLASADLLAGLAAFIDITMGSNLQLGSTSWIILCKTRLGFILLSLLANVYNCLFVTIDRALYMLRPMRYVSIVTTFRASVSILCLWVFVAVQALMFVIFDYDIKLERNVCSIPNDVSKTGGYILVTQYSLIVFGVILPCYCKIILTVRHLRRTEPHVTNFPREQQGNQIKKLKERNMAVTMGWVMGTFVICNIIPVMYGFVVGRVPEFDHFSFNATLGAEISRRVYWAQFMLNSFIYGWRNKLFRRAYKKLLHLPDTNSIANW